MKAGIVLLGRRRAAVAAAKRMGLRPLVLTDGPAADEPERRRWVRPFREETALRELVPALRAAADVRAVVATTEAAVVPAARLRELLGLPGMNAAMAVRCTDKAQMKSAIRARGVACADFVTSEEKPDRAALLSRLGLPLVVKDRASSGSRGVRVVCEADDVPDTLPDGRMAESFVSGCEMSVELLVVDGEPVFENPTEYLRPGWANVVPAVLPPEVSDALREVNRAVIAALGIEHGITHMEVFMEASRIVFGEIAARPPGGHLMPLIEHAYGFDPWAALLRIACGEVPEVPTRAGRAAAVWLFHPGRGRVTRVAGIEEARAMPGVIELPIRVAVGDDIGERIGVGQEVGHVLVTGRDRDEAVERVTAAHDMVQLEVSG